MRERRYTGNPQTHCAREPIVGSPAGWSGGPQLDTGGVPLHIDLQQDLAVVERGAEQGLAVLVEAVRLLDGPCCWPISCSTSVPGAQRNRLALHRIHSNHQTAQPYENCHGQRGRTWSQSPREYPLAWSQFGRSSAVRGPPETCS